ncbi:probable cytochrome P450 311a1 isoform X2 [Episyrphus balteatus]|uniref:probable cytochrome P450 311a1 isoform X2 n=1 Tax=Episyrphus balteatus TaxID=286459 RepID=UPI0024861E1F|nr:probable cytochrome P450 311a1 isoform X2 [Episyrphus balteatus]
MVYTIRWECSILMEFTTKGMIDELRQTYQSTFRILLGPNLWVFLHSPEETREALNEDSLLRADTFQKLNVLLGNGLLLSEGKQWYNHRRSLAPAFHPNVLAGFTDRIYHHSDVFVDKVLKRKELEVSEYIFPCMLDTICETSMGKNLRTQEEECSAYVHAFHDASEILFERMSYPLFFFDWIFNLTPSCKKLQNAITMIHNLTDEIIKEKAEDLKVQGNQTVGKYNRTLLHILLTTEVDGKSMSFQEIKDEVNTFLFAGVDTTAAAMNFILYCLAKYPECQEKLYNEISSDTESNYPNINEMKYLDMFIKECLRFYTIVPLTGRQVTKKINIGNYEIVPGTTLWINMYGLAHDAKRFPEPDKFDPERFGSDGPEIPPYVFLPFSGGPHSCIGKRYAMLIMKIVTVRTLQRTKIQLQNPNEILELKAEMVLKSTSGINLIFEKR